jgi:hypothetical protein
MECHIAGPRVDGRSGVRGDPRNGLRPPVNQGLHIPGITGIPHRQMQGNDEASRRLGKHPGCGAKRCEAVARPTAHRRNGGIVCVDDVAVGQRLAWRESAGLVLNRVLT